MDRAHFPTFEDAETDFQRALTAFLNAYSEENESNTPDFILATYLRAALHAFNNATNQREAWYGRRADLGDAEADASELESAGPQVAQARQEDTMTESLGTAFPAQLQRVKEVLELYKDIGAPGALGAAMINVTLTAAQKAWTEQDTVAMIRLYPALQNIE